MKEFIEQLYDFENSLAHSSLAQEKEIKHAFIIEEKLVKKLEPLLSEEAAEVFKKLQNLHMDLVYNHHKQAFVAGFRTGMRIAVEVYGDD